MWLLVGVMVILGSGHNWTIPLVSSLAFAAAVLVIPAIWEYVLSEKQKAAVSAAVSKALPGKKKLSGHDGWSKLPSVTHSGSDTALAKDVNGGGFNGAPGKGV